MMIGAAVVALGCALGACFGGHSAEAHSPKRPFEKGALAG